MKKQIMENDYESYSFPLPIFFMFGKKKQKYILESLEKLHPCFSEKMAVDTKLHLAGKKIKASVVVMDKLVLTDYKAKNPGKSFFIFENGRRNKVFTERRPVLKIILCILMLLSLLVSMARVIWKMPLFGMHKNQLVSEKTEISAKTEHKEVLGPNVKDVFDVISNHKGVAESLSYKNLGQKTSVNISVTGVFPEDFEKISGRENIRFSSVSYRETNPLITLGFDEIRELQNVETASEINARQSDFKDETKSYKAVLRNLAFNAGMKIIREESSPFSMEVTFDSSSGLENVLEFFSEVHNLLKSESLYCPQLKLVHTDKKSLSFSLFFTLQEGARDDDIFNLILENQNLFFEGMPLKKAESQSGKVTASKNAIAAVDEGKSLPQEKIGMIGHPDGKQSVYFKNGSGKISYGKN